MAPVAPLESDIAIGPAVPAARARRVPEKNTFQDFLPVTQLLDMAAPYNPRAISPQQLQALERSITLNELVQMRDKSLDGTQPLGAYEVKVTGTSVLGGLRPRSVGLTP